MSARAGQEAEEGSPREASPETSVSSHSSLCLRWNSRWPPAKTDRSGESYPSGARRDESDSENLQPAT